MRARGTVLAAMLLATSVTAAAALTDADHGSRSRGALTLVHSDPDSLPVARSDQGRLFVRRDDRGWTEMRAPDVERVEAVVFPTVTTGWALGWERESCPTARLVLRSVDAGRSWSVVHRLPWECRGVAEMRASGDVAAVELRTAGGYPPAASELTTDVGRTWVTTKELSKDQPTRGRPPPRAYTRTWRGEHVEVREVVGRRGLWLEVEGADRLYIPGAIFVTVQETQRGSLIASARVSRTEVVGFRLGVQRSRWSVVFRRRGCAELKPARTTTELLAACETSYESADDGRTWQPLTVDTIGA